MAPKQSNTATTSTDSSSATKSSLWQNLPLYGLGFLFFGMIILGAGAEIWTGLKQSQPQDHPYHSSDPQFARLTEALQMHELEPPPQRTWTAQPLNVPAIMPGTSGNGVLHGIVSHHPHPLVSVEFNAVLASGEVGMMDDPEDGAAANFSVLLVEQIAYSQKEVQGDRLPVLVVPFRDLATIHTRDEILRWWLVLYHEALHWQQWLNGESQEVKDAFLMKDHREGTSPQECTNILQFELDAYNAECELAREWGRPELPLGDMCLYDEGPDRDYFIFGNMAGAHYQRIPECLPVWAEMVGHPQPELFEL